MSKVVLDTSALLAFVNDEPGAQILMDNTLIGNLTMSAVNVSEAYAKLVSRGAKLSLAWEAVTGPVTEIVSFDEEQGRIAGELVAHTKSLGLSLGDRACLALGIFLKAPVYTADRVWKQLKIGASIKVIR